MCANIVVRSRAHGFSPTLLRAFARVLLPRRPGAAEAFLGPRRDAREVRDDGLRGAGRHGGREAIQRRALQGHRGPPPALVLWLLFFGSCPLALVLWRKDCIGEADKMAVAQQRRRAAEAHDVNARLQKHH